MAKANKSEKAAVETHKKGRGRPRKPKSEPNEAGVSSERLILDAYFRLAQEKGAGSVNLQMVAQEAGVAFGTVRYNFSADDGRDLVQSALLDLVQKAYRFIEERMYVERANADFNPLAAYANAMFDWVGKSKADSSLLIYYYYLCTTQAPVAIPNTVFLERARLRVESLLHEAIGRKLYRDVENSRDVALQIHAVVTGTCVIAATLASPEGLEIQRALCLQMIDKLLSATVSP